MMKTKQIRYVLAIVLFFISCNKTKPQSVEDETALLEQSLEDVTQKTNPFAYLQKAIERNKPETVRAFLKRSDLPDDADASEWTLLMYAAESNNLAIVKVLVEHGAKDKAGDAGNALAIAAEKNNYEMVKYLYNNAGSGVNKFGLHTPPPAIISAAAHGNLNMANFLLRKEADINIKGCPPIEDNAVIAAVANGHIKMVKYLIINNANVNQKDSDNKTALDYAKEKNYSKIVSLLSRSGGKEGYKL